MSARRQEVLDALVAIQERRIFKPPLHVTALKPSGILPGERCAAFWSFVDERGRAAVAFASDYEQLDTLAETLLPGAKRVELTKPRSELGAPILWVVT
jgi:hypothetical protein